ncbi:MAG: zinc ABC transporter substrate-binding protein [Rhizobiaceae bacterium]|nr:zinc ABC transporter substrate-binding protein [Rhizobiaceae bacterium]
MRLFISALSASLMMSGSVLAAPKVVASIQPLHSLVAGVMDGVGTPELIVQEASSPHGFSLKPSQARSLQQSDIVFWVGHGLETFLEKPLETVAADATTVEMLETPGLTKFGFRESDGFEAHDHDHDHGHGDHGHDDHGHDGHEHDDHDKTAKDDHDHDKEHSHDHDDKHEHDHSETDPHIWLDPQNAVKMVETIRATLSENDPENAETYAANAKALSQKLNDLDEQISAKMASSGKGNFIVFHDAYHYFEARYGLEAAGSITLNPENLPGAKRVRELQEKIKSLKVTCIFSEPQFDPKIITTVTEGLSTRTSTLDPLGAALDPGKEQYFTLMENMANSFAECISDG